MTQIVYPIRNGIASIILCLHQSMAQYALKGYEVAALDFVLKPVTYASFAMKLKRAVKNIRKLKDALVYYFFARRIRREGAVGVDNRFLTLFILIMLLLMVVLSYLRSYFAGDTFDPALYVIFNLCSVISGVFALFIQLGLYLQSQLAQKLEITEQLLYSKQEQFKVSEETIECINLSFYINSLRLSSSRLSNSSKFSGLSAR